MTAWPHGCFTGKSILISGGTSGIGAAIALAFHREGAKVTVTGATEAEVGAATGRMPGVTCRQLDIRDGSDVSQFMGEMPALDHLVNCAGVIRREAEHDPEVFQDVVDVNLNGTMRLCAAARPLLAKSEGTIVNTASMLSFFGGGLVPGYAASKGGVAQLTKSLAIAYAAEGIRVNAIAPGWIRTPLTTSLQADETRETAILNRTPLGRWGEPEDIAGSVLFIASPLAAFITGAVLPVDGGYLIT